MGIVSVTGVTGHGTTPHGRRPLATPERAGSAPGHPARALVAVGSRPRAAGAKVVAGGRDVAAV